MLKVFIVYQHRNMRKIVFGYTKDEKIAVSELMRLTNASCENHFSMEYNFIPYDGVLLKDNSKN